MQGQAGGKECGGQRSKTQHVSPTGKTIPVATLEFESVTSSCNKGRNKVAIQAYARGKQSRPRWYPVRIPVEALMNALVGLLHLLDANRSLRSLILQGTLW